MAKNENSVSKTKLAISIISLIIVIILLIMGIVLYFVIEDKNKGTIEIDGSNVNIEATSTIEGMDNPPTLQPIIISEDSSSDHQVWDNIDLVFANKDAVITINITIVNNSQYNALDLVFDNQTTTNNVVMTEQYYKNGLSENVVDLTTTTDRLFAQESITYVISFSIKDSSNSVNDIIDITISCVNVDVEM